jgi:putative ABC transport system permease protein
MALAGGVRQEIRAVDRNAPILGLQTMDQAVAEKVSEPKFETTVLSTLAALALGLAMLGVYGLISIAVNQRTREIGVRIALGASQRAIMRMVIGEGMRLVLCGIGIGICGAVVLSRFLRSLLFEVKPTDFVTLVSVVLLFVIVALVACFIPARRAIRVHPAVALRYE